MPPKFVYRDGIEANSGRGQRLSCLKILWDGRGHRHLVYRAVAGESSRRRQPATTETRSRSCRRDLRSAGGQVRPVRALVAAQDLATIADLQCVVLDCPDPGQLAEFHRSLLGGAVDQQDRRWALGEDWATPATTRPRASRAIQRRCRPRVVP
ncbi:VOC family protein [Streptomyces sp. NPDC054786]